MAVLTRGLSERFEEFLRGFEDKEGEHKYQVLLAQLAASGRKSVIVNYEDLIHYDTDLAESLLKDPDKAMREFKSATFEVLSTENSAYAGEIRKSLTVRTRGITETIALRKVDTSHLDKMIAFAGMVIRTSELRPLLVDGAFVCPNGHTTRVIQEGPVIKKPIKCEACDETRNLELDQKESGFIDSQILRVQELPEELPPGQLPRFFDVDVEGDIVNTARPGDRAMMTGIVRAEPDFTLGQPRSRSFRSKIDANYIEVVGKEPSQVHISKEDEAIIKSIAAMPDAYQKLTRSMAPAILGHEAVKEAMLLLLVGGPQTVLPDGTKLRGDINILLVGDPGVAKSEMLKFAAQVAPRGMFASGRGSSLDYGQQVIVRRGGTVQMVKIGELVDHYYLPGISGAFVPVADLECLSYSASTGKVEWTDVGHVYRHRHEGPLTKLTLQTGREVIVTDDHSIYAFKDGKLRPIATKDLRLGDCVAIPGRLPAPHEDGFRRSLFPDDLATDARLATLLGYYVAEGYLHEGKKKGKESYRIHFELNEKETDIVNEIRDSAAHLFQVGINVRKRKDSKGITVTISSKKALLLFRDVLAVSRGARRKRVPTIVFNMPREVQLEFLRAYLNGDRGVTSSPLLISDLLYLVGQCCKVTGKFVRKKATSGRINGREFHGGPHFQLKAPDPYDIHKQVRPLPPPLMEALPPFEAILMSQKSGKGFFTNEYERMTEKVHKRLMSGRRSRRVALLRALDSRGASTAKDVSQALGLDARNARQMLRLCEKAGLVSVQCTDRLFQFSITEKGRQAVSLVEEIGSIAHSDLQFAKIKKIERAEPSSEFVYDLSVPERENFIAGVGGVLCHNTAAGLSAAVIREKNTFMLEAGVVVLADQGIACLHPQSTVLLDGKVVEIDRLAETLDFIPIEAGDGRSEVATMRSSVVSFREDSLSTGTGQATRMRRRRHSGEIIRIKLRSGFEQAVTPDHLFLDGNSLEWKEAGKFATGDYLTAPQSIPGERAEEELLLWDILPEDCTVSLTAAERDQLRVLLETEYGTINRAAGQLGIPRIKNYFRNRLQPTLSELRRITRALGAEETWRRQAHVYDRSPIRATRVTPELAYICGFIFGDGNVRISSRRAAITLTQSPRHEAYTARFAKYWQLHFEALKLRKTRRTRATIRGKAVVSERVDWSVSRRILGHIYSFLTQDHLANLPSLPDEVLKAFLAGATDSDGYSGSKRSEKDGIVYETWNVVYEASKDRAANLNLLLALRRFGVIGSYRGVRGGVGVIVVSSRVDCSRLQDALSDYSVKMARKPAARLRDISGISEKLPKSIVADAFREIFQGAERTPLIKAGVWSTIYGYMNELRQPSTGQVVKVASKAAHVSGTSRLLRIAEKNYFLDEVVGVSREPYEGYVYDIMMQSDHNYVADGVFSHNCIDEFDKMKPEDRSALHESMEQQTVTIAKGGIYATLNARTAILAASNPILGKYNPYQNLIDNITLPIPLLTRFDLIFVLRDTPSAGQDEKLATHILDVHRKRAYIDSPPVQFELMKKYIAYAKNYTPVLTLEAEHRIKEFYLQLRRSATEGQIGATPRTLESLIRLASAKARLMLREQVTDDDALTAISLMNKMVEDVLTDTDTKTKADFGILLGQPAGERGKLSTVMDVLRALEGPDRKPVEAKVLKQELIRTNKFANEDEVDKLIQKITKEGIVFESKPGFLRRVQG